MGLQAPILLKCVVVRISKELEEMMALLLLPLVIVAITLLIVVAVWLLMDH